MEYELFQSQKEDRERQDKMRVMQLKTQRLEGRIAKRELGTLSHELMPDLSAHYNYRLKSKENDKSRFLQEKLKRRESLIKQELSNGALEKACEDKNTINVENQHREEQIRKPFEKE